MNSFITKMGFDTSLYDLTDVLSIEPWALGMIPQPVAAVMMLYPLTDVQKEYCWNEQVTPTPDNVWFIQEHIKNSCGTIGLHTLLNAPEGVRTVTIHPNSWIHSFYQDCPVALSPAAKEAEQLEGDSTIKTLHYKAMRDESNQTPCRNLEDEVINHFINMVHVYRGLYELDGQKEGLV